MRHSVACRTDLVLNGWHAGPYKLPDRECVCASCSLWCVPADPLSLLHRPHPHDSSIATRPPTSFVPKDTYVDPLPAGAIPLVPARPNRLPFQHASGNSRPLRTVDPKILASAGGSFEFQPGSVMAYHRNQLTEGQYLEDLFKEQGIESLLSTTPDYWTDRQSGFLLDGEPGSAELRRVDSHTLASTVPNTSFTLRATVLAVQTDSAADWIADVAALLATATPAAEARVAHEGWWAGFWSRSYIAVNESQWRPPPSPPPPPPPAPPPPPPPPASSLPVAGAVLWLRASTLASSHSTGQPVSSWSEVSLPGATVSQSNATVQPTFVANALGVGPAVRFNGAGEFLGNPNTTLPEGSTHFAVLRDTGSAAQCCSGVTFWESDVGISTKPTLDGAIHVLADGPGVDVESTVDVRNRTVIADATYGADGAVAVSASGCSTATSAPFPRRCLNSLLKTFQGAGRGEGDFVMSPCRCRGTLYVGADCCLKFNAVAYARLQVTTARTPIPRALGAA